MTAPRVSVIIPAFDAAATLSETLESLQAQTFRAWEAVIVDDGSTDRTAEIAAAFAASDQRLRVTRQPNVGESAARNAGVALATGDWLTFLDADDWLVPTYLERMIRAADADPEADVFHCGWVRVARGGEHSPNQFAPPAEDLFPTLARHNCFAIHACMVRRSIVLSIGPFDVTLRTCPDWDFWLRIARTPSRFALVPETLACYRVRPGAAGTHTKQVLNDALTVIARAHQPDPRVPSPDVRYAQGMPADLAAKAKLEFLCWAGGLAIGQGQPTEPLLEMVAGERAAVSAERVAEALFLATPLPTGHLAGSWGRLWPAAETGIDSFLAALEAHGQSPGLAAQCKLLLMRRIVIEMLPAFLSRRRPGGDAATTRPTPAPPAPYWERVASERAEQIADQQRWIGELEGAKEWHDQQRQIWQRRAEAAEGQAAGLGRTARFPIGLTSLLGKLRRPAAQRTPDPFADPRMVEPVSREWGYDRGRPIDRYYIERFLQRHDRDVKGRVLEIGDNSYTRRFGADRVVTSDVLHVVPGNDAATFVADLTHADHIPTDAFDCIILTQTLQLIYDLPSALRSAHRVLKPGGVLLATFPGLTRTSRTEWSGSWFWRLTPAATRRLFEAVFLSENLEVRSHGNVLAASAFLYGLAMEELTAAELDHEDPDYDVIVTVRAVKAVAARETGDPGVTAGRRREVDVPSAAAPALVLLYHRIAGHALDPWQLSVSPDRFDDQLNILKRETTVIRLPELLGEVTASTGRPVDRPLVAITFDDGYSDNLSHALGLLHKHNLPATVLVCTGPVSQGAEFWWDTLERLLLWPTRVPPSLELEIQGQLYHWDLRDSSESFDRASRAHSDWRAWEPPPTSRHALYVALWQRLHQLDPDERERVLTALQAWAGPAAQSRPRCRALDPAELGILAESPLIEIGAHTINHPALSRLPIAQQQREIAGSRTWLEARLRRPVVSFSYPFGRIIDYTPETVTAVRDAGFGCACSNVGGLVRSGADPLQLPRVQVKDWPGEEFAAQLRSWLF